ncbi:MAG: aminoglycoside phosphotransferase [Betaproteobacteria bacterium RIFCSPHIGHO2_12_FULL_69_13]|nr:MAG: aminoglycoside phosphotransferase [Betaproteobacteria bacterium RIFCSPHIGHO2_12_FULL_69_13]
MNGHDNPDLGRLTAYFERHVQGTSGALVAERFTGGQSNPTYRIADSAGHRFVLRKKPSGVLLPSAHAVDREYRVLKALQETDVPVPRVLAYCDDPRVIGTPFYVMEFVEGRIFWDPTLPELSPADRTALYEDVNRMVATLHRVDVGAVGLGDYGRPGRFMERQIARWTKQYLAAATEPIEAMDRLIHWLSAHMPPGDESAVFHGDLRLDNMIVHPVEPRVLAVLDWELSTIGHPLADLAYHMLPWHLTAQQFRGMADKPLAALGIPSENQYLRAYCSRVGRRDVEPTEWSFYVAYAMFRLAAILQGILKRSLDGTAFDKHARETGMKAGSIAAVAWKYASSTVP